MDIRQNDSTMTKLPLAGKTDKITPVSEIPASNLRMGIYVNGDLYPTKEACREYCSKSMSTSIEAERDSSTVTPEGYLSDREKGLTWAATLINFMKGMIGPGCLSLPLAFKQAGLWTAFALVFLFGFLNNYCMLQLVHSSQHLSKKHCYAKLDYGGVAFETCADSFKCLRRYKHWAKGIVNTAILGLQLGVCSVFYVFMAVHMKEIFDDQTSFKASATAWMFIILPPVILLNFLRSLRTIAIFSMIGNVLMICAFLFILQHLLRAEHVIGQLPWITNFDGIMTACGSILYSFNGQAMVLPLKNKLKHPPGMVGVFGVLSVGMSLVSSVYAASGILRYITYGADVKGSITLNLPQKTLQHHDNTSNVSLVDKCTYKSIRYFCSITKGYIRRQVHLQKHPIFLFNHQGIHSETFTTMTIPQMYPSWTSALTKASDAFVRVQSPRDTFGCIDFTTMTIPRMYPLWTSALTKASDAFVRVQSPRDTFGCIDFTTMTIPRMYPLWTSALTKASDAFVRVQSPRVTFVSIDLMHASYKPRAFTTVKLMLTLVVYFGFVIQQYVIVDMIWPKLVRLMDINQIFSNNRLRLPLELLFRAFVTIIAMTIAIAVPNLEDIIPLVGVTAGMFLAFIFPALMDTMTFVPLYLNQTRADGSNMRWKAYLRLIQNGFLVLIGVFGLVAGLNSNIRNMIQRPITA